MHMHFFERIQYFMKRIYISPNIIGAIAGLKFNFNYETILHLLQLQHYSLTLSPNGAHVTPLLTKLHWLPAACIN